jgi:hypothetical protein
MAQTTTRVLGAGERARRPRVSFGNISKRGARMLAVSGMKRKNGWEPSP